MVYACCVPSCNNNGKVRSVSLHSFTKDPALGKLWMNSIALDTQMSKLDPKPLTVTKYTKICSAHFKKTDYTVGSGLNRLNPGAVPTIFPWTSKRISSQTRAKQKELLVQSLQELEQLTKFEQKLEVFDTGAANESFSAEQKDGEFAAIRPKTEEFDTTETSEEYNNDSSVKEEEEDDDDEEEEYDSAARHEEYERKAREEEYEQRKRNEEYEQRARNIFFDPRARNEELRARAEEFIRRARCEALELRAREEEFEARAREEVFDMRARDAEGNVLEASSTSSSSVAEDNPSEVISKAEEVLNSM